MENYNIQARANRNRIIAYLQKHGYNTPQEICQELNLDEAEWNLAICEDDGRIKIGVRPDSYGVSVAWVQA